MQVMQEVESHWTSGRCLPDVASATMSDVLHETVLNNCLATVNAAIAVRQRSANTAQVHIHAPPMELWFCVRCIHGL